MKWFIVESDRVQQNTEGSWFEPHLRNLFCTDSPRKHVLQKLPTLYNYEKSLF